MFTNGTPLRGQNYYPDFINPELGQGNSATVEVLVLNFVHIFHEDELIKMFFQAPAF